MGRRRNLNLLALVAIFSAPITALSYPPHSLFGRDSTCASKDATQCQGAPDGFCCPSNSICSVLASNTTVLCCPSDQDCSVIKTITCDISQQNATAFPDAQLKTTNLTASLSTCGDQCCPFGYSCSNKGDTCKVNADQGSAPSHTSSISSSTSTPTIAPAVSSSSTSSSSPTAPAASSSATSCPETVCSAFPAKAVVAGFFPGLALGAILSVAAFCIIGARRNKQDNYTRRPASGGSFGKVSASISDPIYQEGSAMRTDFIRKTPYSPNTPTRQPTIQRVRSLFRKSAASTNASSPYMSQHSPVPPMPLVTRPPPTPRTPRMQREPSGESINIFADPSTARSIEQDHLGVEGHGPHRASHQTTFTDMMERADLGGMRHGHGYVETPPQGKRWPYESPVGRR